MIYDAFAADHVLFRMAADLRDAQRARRVALRTRGTLLALRIRGRHRGKVALATSRTFEPPERRLRQPVAWHAFGLDFKGFLRAGTACRESLGNRRVTNLPPASAAPAARKPTARSRAPRASFASICSASTACAAKRRHSYAIA
jgi:hypothetical protein